MSEGVAYIDLARHGDTMFDKETNTRIFLLHARFTENNGFIGYARNGFIFILTNTTIDMVDERFLGGSRTVLTEKHRPFYSERKVWSLFSENHYSFGFLYERTPSIIEKDYEK